MTQYAVIELGKVLGAWLLVAVVLTAGVGVLLWLVVLTSAHLLALLYRCRGYRVRVVRDGIEIRVRRVPRRGVVVTVVEDQHPYSLDGGHRSGRATRYLRPLAEDADSWRAPVGYTGRQP